MSSNGYESDTGSDISYLDETDDDRMPEETISKVFDREKEVPPAKMDASDMKTFQVREVACGIGLACSFLVVIIGILIFSVQIYPWNGELARAAQQEEHVKLIELVKQAREELDRAQKTREYVMNRNDAFRNQYLRFLYWASGEAFDLSQLDGDWKLIGSMSADEFHEKRPRKTDESSTGRGLRFKSGNDYEFSMHFYSEERDENEDHFGSEFNGKQIAVWEKQCLVLSGKKTSTMNICIKDRHLHVKEESNGVERHRFYEHL